MSGPLTPARAAAVAFENSVRHNLVECGAIISQTGQILCQRTGQAGQVSFPHGELLRGVGATFAHNHPGGTGPSLSDLELAIEYGFHELRVVTRHQRFMVYNFASVQRAALITAYLDNWQKVERAVMDEIKRGQTSRHDFGGELVHRTLERTSIALGFRYDREQS